MKKRFTYILVLITMLLVPICVSARIILLDYTWCNWGADGANVYMWTWGGGNGGQWSTKFLPVPGESNLYYAEIPDEVTDCNVVRENPNTTEHSDHWNRTGNLNLPTNGYNTMKMWSDYQTGSEHNKRTISATFTIWETDWAKNYYAWYTSSRGLTAGWPGKATTSSDCECAYDTFTFDNVGMDAYFIINGDGTQTGNVPLIKYLAGGNYKATVGSNVLTSFIPVSRLTMPRSKLGLLPDKTYTLNVTVVPNNASNKAIIWTSSNPSIVSVESDGTITAHAVGSATITAKAMYSECITATCDVTVDDKTIPVYFDVSTTGWGENIQAHYWWDGCSGDINAVKVPSGENLGLFTSSTWYKADVPVNPLDGKVSFQAKKTDNPATGDYSEKMENRSAACAFYIYESQDGNKHHTYRDETANLPTRYYVASQTASKWHVSNPLTAAGTFSYYTTAGATKYAFYKGNNLTGYFSETALQNEAKSEVYYTTFDGTAVATPAVYNDNFYIHTYRAYGQKEALKPYGAMTEQERDSACLTKFSPSTEYSHYWVEFYDQTKENRIGARVGNIYNDELAYIEDATLTSHANVRFGYNPTTNILSRAMIGGSSDNDKYLTIYSPITGDLKTADGASNIDNDHLAKFTDISNWCYEIDVQAIASGSADINVVVLANYNGENHYLFGKDASNIPITRNLLGASTDAGTYPIRVIYDFKTNRLVGGWVIDEDQTITNKRNLNANLMIVRTEEDAAKQIILENGAEIAGIKQVYTVLEITKEGWQAWKAKPTGDYWYMWISLPYDCYLQDIYGLENYGSTKNDKWCIQRYRGDKRAELGWFRETPTFWANMKRTSSTAKMEAGRGYILRLNLAEKDFKTINQGKDNEKAVLRLYFPSSAEERTLRGGESVIHQVPVHDRNELSKVDKRRIPDDSNWNVIGVMGFQDMNSTGWTTSSDSNAEDADNTSEDKTTTRENYYFYTWAWNYVTNKGEYTLSSTVDNEFEFTKAYMVQFGGEITWTPATQTTSELQARKAPAQHQNAVLCLHLTSETAADKTYLQLDETATTEYDLNSDLGKIVNEGCVQVYTLTAPRTVTDAAGNAVVEQSQLAANYLPIESQSVALGIQAPAAGEYTFSMPSVPAGVIPTLYDSKTGATINLAFDKYTVSLEQGTDEKRFVLQLNVQNTPTGCEDLTVQDAYRITQVGNSLLISGLTEPADIRLYDSLGRMLYEGSVQYEAIPVTQTGVYLLNINGNVQRILIK